MTPTLPDGMEYKDMVQACTDAVATGVWGSEHPEVDGVRNHIVAVTGVRDEVGDIIVPGAFIKSLQRITPKACMGHDWNRAIGEPEAIEELMPGDPRLPAIDRFGNPWPAKAGALFARTRYNLAKKDGQDAYADAQFHGPRLACSIGYVDPKDEQTGKPLHSYKAVDPDTGLMTRFLPELHLFEYSQVLHGAHLLAGGLKTGKPTRLQRKARQPRPSMEIKATVRLVRDSGYWGLPLGTPIRAGMKPQGPKARRLVAAGQQADTGAGAVEVDANNLRIKPTAKGKKKGDVAVNDAYSGIMSLLDDEADPFEDSFETDDTQKINKGEPYNPLDILVANAIPPADVEEHLRNNSDWDQSRLGDAAERQDQIDSYIADVADAYREKYNAELVRQNDKGGNEVADPDAESDVSAETPDTSADAPAVSADAEQTAPEEVAPAAGAPEPQSSKPTDEEWQAAQADMAAAGQSPEDPNRPPVASSPDAVPEMAVHNGDPVNIRAVDGDTANVYNTRTEQAYDVPVGELLTGGPSPDAPADIALNDAQREAADLAFGNGESIDEAGAVLTASGIQVGNVAEALATIDARFEVFEDNPEQKRRHGRTLKSIRAKIAKLAKPGEPIQPSAATGDAAASADDVSPDALPGNGDAAAQPSTEVAPEQPSEESTVDPEQAMPDTETSVTADPLAPPDPLAEEGGTGLVEDVGQAQAEAIEENETISGDEVADAEEMIDASFGVIESPDGEFEVEPDIAERQDRVASLLTQAETGGLDLSPDHVGDDQLRVTRADIVDELRLQQHLERRRAGEQAVTRQQAEAQAADDLVPQEEPDRPVETGPKPRPGVTGAAEDLADAIDDGDQARIDAATERLRKSVNRSRSDSEVTPEIRALLDVAPEPDPITGEPLEGRPDPAALRDAAQRLRDEQRAKRNAGARRRRAARRFERERLRSLLGQVEAEMRNRNLDFDPIPDEDGNVTLDLNTTPAVAWTSRIEHESWSGTDERVDELSGANYQASISSYGNKPPTYNWTVTSDEGSVLATGKNTAPDVDSARTAVEIALDTQRRLGLIPIDAQIPQGHVPEDTSATPLASVVDAVGRMRQRITDGRELNPITGRPDPLVRTLTPLPVPAAPMFDDAGAVRKHLEASGVTRRTGSDQSVSVTTLYRWDTAKMTPGGAFVIVDDLQGKPQAMHTVTGGTFNPLLPNVKTALNRADLLRYATIAEATVDLDGRPIDWSQDAKPLMADMNSRSFVADGDGRGGRGLQDVAINRLTREKIHAGQFNHALVLASGPYIHDVTNSNRKGYVENWSRTLGQLLNARAGKPSAFDRKTLDTAKAAHTLAALGAPDAAAVLLSRRAAEIRDEFGGDAHSHGAPVLDTLAGGYLGMFSPVRSHGERVGDLKAGERLYLSELPEIGGELRLRSFRATSPARRDPRGMGSIATVIDEKTGEQMFLHIGASNFQIRDTDDINYSHTPLSEDRADGLFAVVGPGEESPVTVDDLRTRALDDINVIPQDVLDAAAEALPESGKETAARRATPGAGVRPPRQGTPRAPKRTAQAPAAPEPVRGEQHLAEAQGRSMGAFLGMPFEYGDKPEKGSFDSIEAVREHLVDLEGGSDPKAASSARAVIALIDDGKMTLSPGGAFLVGKNGWVSHAASSQRVWPPTPNSKIAFAEFNAGGGTANQAAGMRVARALESGVFDGEQLDWSGNGLTAVKQTGVIAQRNGSFHPMVTAQRAAYLDGSVGAAKPRITDVHMLRGVTRDVEADAPNPEVLNGAGFVIEPLVAYDHAGGTGTGNFTSGMTNAVADTKAGSTLAKRVALEIRIAEAAATTAPLDAVRRLTRIADELDGKTITRVKARGTDGEAPQPLVPSDDLRAIASKITDAFDPNKISESGRFRGAGMVGQVEFSKPKITSGRVWQDPNNVAAQELETRIRDAGGIRFYRDDNGMLHATFAGIDIADGQHNGKTFDGDSIALNGTIKLLPNGTLTVSYTRASRVTIIEGGPGDWKLMPEETAADGDTEPDISEPETESPQVETPDDGDTTADAPGGLEDKIREAYGRLADAPQDWIRLARIRAELGDADQAEVDKALLEMVKTGLVHLVASANRKVLTDEDHAAAIRIGDEDKHLIAIEEDDEPSSPNAPVDTESKIRKVYEQLANEPQDWVRIARIRALLGDMDQGQVDEALKAMMRTGFVHLAPESNTKVLTDEDRSGALRVGSEDMHLIAIEPKE